MEEDNILDLNASDDVSIASDGLVPEEEVTEAELVGEEVLPEDEPVAGDEEVPPTLSIGAE